MSTVRSQSSDPALQREPAWAVAELFPDQGAWTEWEYLSLPGNRLIELSDGRVEVLPMPTTSHQLVVLYLYRLLHEFVAARSLGLVLVSAIPVRLWPGKFREPDVLFMGTAHQGRIREQYWEAADLVMEVVSENDPKRDLEVKRAEYAQAGIPEYWIVEPRSRTITVLNLSGSSYEVTGVFGGGQRAGSVLLPGFEVAVDDVFAVSDR